MPSFEVQPNAKVRMRRFFTNPKCGALAGQYGDRWPGCNDKILPEFYPGGSNEKMPILCRRNS